MTIPPLARLALLSLPLVLAGACGDDGGANPTVSPSATATSTAARTSTPLITLEPSGAVAFDEPVTFYGAEPNDQASGLATGDFNGDGAMDVALAAAFADGRDNSAEDAGEVYLFFGPFTPGESRDAAALEQDVTLFGAEPGAQAGRGLASGDVTGDGLDDLLVGAPLADPAGRLDAGAVFVAQGRGQWPDTLDLASEGIRLIGADAEDLAGYSLAAGDATGDGVADIVVSSFWGDGPEEDRTDAGEVYVIPGGPGLSGEIDLASPPEGSWTIYGAAPGVQLGETVGVGLVTEDDVADLILAATFGNGPGGSPERVGNVYVVQGRVSDVPGSTSVFDFADEEPWIFGRDRGDQLGHAIASGDFDGDGFGDLLLGAVSADGPENARDLAGEAVVVPGAANRPASPLVADESEVSVFYGGDAGHRIGRSLAAGDVDGDGRADIVLVAPGSDANGQNSGAALIFLGRTEFPRTIDLAATEADAEIPGRDAADALGTSTSAKPSLLVSDMDGDGRADVIAASVGGAGPANDRRLAGEAYIFFSRPSP